MDTRLSSEQAALAETATRLVDRLGPGTVAGLDDHERRTRLAEALAEAGWRELRDDAGHGAPLASGTEIGLVARAMGRGAADLALLGPLLAAELARRAGTTLPGAATVALSPDLLRLAETDGDALADAAVAWDADGADHAVVLIHDGDRQYSLGTMAIAETGVSADLTRHVAGLAPGSAVSRLSGDRMLGREDLVATQALGLAASSNDLVGVMEGALTLAADYARERRQYDTPIGAFQAVQHLLAEAKTLLEGSISVAMHAGWAVDALTADAALGAAATAKAYCARAAVEVCETGIQVHGGIGNTWECMAHVFLRRALQSGALFGDDTAQLRHLAHVRTGPQGPTADAASAGRTPSAASAGSMTYEDSPDEAEFRTRLRAWLVDNNPGLPASSTDDEYWEHQAEWHTALFEAGFFALTWPKKWGGHELPHTYEVIVDDELAAAGTPPKPSLGYLIQGMSRFGSDELCDRFIPGLVNGRERWCQGFSEPDAGSDLAALATTAVLDGDEYLLNGHKIWTSYSDVADWCLLLARTDPDAPKHKGLSAFAVPMNQPGIEQRPLPMINGISNEFGQVLFDRARVSADNMIGEPGRGWALAMTIVSFEREPAELGYVARYAKTVRELEARVRSDEAGELHPQAESVAWAHVQTEMLRLHVARRLSERMDDPDPGSNGSVDKLLMTWVEQAVGTAARTTAGASAVLDSDDVSLKTYLYSRSQSVMGGTSQIQKNIIATRLLDLPTS